MFLERFIKTVSILIVIALFTYGAYLSFSIFFWKNVYRELPVEQKTIKIVNAVTGKEEEIIYNKNSLKKGDPFAFLLMGTDSDTIERGRSDTLILGVAEPQTNSINLISIPRDSWVTNPATGRHDKITHTFNNGVPNTIKAVEDYFQVPITYYALINMNGFIDMVNSIGGLDVNVEKKIQFQDRITHKFVTLLPGEHHLNGNETINYARFRGDGEGYFGRNRRQRQVLVDLMKQTVSFHNVRKINEMTKVLEENFRTNVSSSSIPLLLSQFHFGSDMKINQIELKGYPARAGRMSIVKVDESERLKVASELQTMLKLTSQQSE